MKAGIANVMKQTKEIQTHQPLDDDSHNAWPELHDFFDRMKISVWANGESCERSGGTFIHWEVAHLPGGRGDGAHRWNSPADSIGILPHNSDEAYEAIGTGNKNQISKRNCFMHVLSSIIIRKAPLSELMISPGVGRTQPLMEKIASFGSRISPGFTVDEYGIK
ncbi:hypothetical protein Fot_16657 [Forsythia ovata]|uniref:Uncharacterized protein n=1 Tax=Forsythia ovata TaxID=205694 RepID=A0ABD1VDG3_9LAMI